jgi:hypothetical protein
MEFPQSHFNNSLLKIIFTIAAYRFVLFLANVSFTFINNSYINKTYNWQKEKIKLFSVFHKYVNEANNLPVSSALSSKTLLPFVLCTPIKDFHNHIYFNLRIQSFTKSFNANF